MRVSPLRKRVYVCGWVGERARAHVYVAGRLVFVEESGVWGRPVYNRQRLNYTPLPIPGESCTTQDSCQHACNKPRGRKRSQSSCRRGGCRTRAATPATPKAATPALDAVRHQSTDCLFVTVLRSAKTSASSMSGKCRISQNPSCACTHTRSSQWQGRGRGSRQEPHV